MKEALRALYRCIRFWRSSDDHTRAAMMAWTVDAARRAGMRVREVGRDSDRERNLPYLTRMYLFAVREPIVLWTSIALAAIHLPFNVPLSALFLTWGVIIGEITAFVHCFSQSDPDPLHDHPWRWYIRIILTGGYWEHTFDGVRWIQPGLRSIALRAGSRFHRVELPAPALDRYATWTIFIHGPRRYTWGFLFKGLRGIERTNESEVRTSQR